ncbi:hypothetical protein BX661DRAFT_176621 [Kickxella alabastrina]|uniref:uncharacterized protein n=1 Tax=Kickxella alabastrina TaxID=61397 RepID=UPI002220977C|nr:uncharacterized protein BX661DRAFT_176621 [Kickxella alabastrina]KAI7834090.1 hypothetical protein BX661DRAFT_176621 [Kickxella alabastrina]
MWNVALYIYVCVCMLQDALLIKHYILNNIFCACRMRRASSSSASSSMAASRRSSPCFRLGRTKTKTDCPVSSLPYRCRRRHLMLRTDCKLGCKTVAINS